MHLCPWCLGKQTWNFKLWHDLTMELADDAQENAAYFNKVLETLKCQFLSCFPVNSIQWKRLPQNITWEQQELIIKNTCGHDLNKRYPIKLDYQMNFLKRLIQSLEHKCCEIHDDIYNEYCKIQLESSKNSEDFVYKHYVLPKFNTHLTMQEAKTFVSKGTTGLCTWQASLVLADFLLHNKDYICKKTVIELGAGTGLCGMVLMRCTCVAAHAMYLTDGSEDCVNLMRKNIQRNFDQATEKENGLFKLSDEDELLGAFYLSWAEVNDFQFSKISKPDLILAADVVYDDSIFQDLLHAIFVVFEKSHENAKMLLAATVRNEETLEAFLKLVSSKYLVKQCAIVPESESYLQWDRTTSVKIFEITQFP